METERWRKIERLYHSALVLEGSHRAAFLEEACVGDEPLRGEVESLLAPSEETEPFLEASALEVAARDLAGSYSHPAAIGRYRIIRLLGEGGMGSVYEAEQDEPRRTVAVKIVKFGLASPDRVRRFRQERQILAGLAHPRIARLFDGGYTDAGAPYLVMEYVEGLPITQWCDERNLDLPERLRLFQKLCDAVHFAHQHLVVHRDLKPPNVLVTPDGEPRLLDFGIAQLLDPVGDSTRTTDCALTLDYASPEQVRGDAITTACDIYSLGILLYELIAGKRLYCFAGRPLEETIDCICKRDPAPPSSVASKPFADDLDAIVLKALRKEPQDRYASARALNDDIERYLRSLPVLARRGTVRYVATKFIWRHRAAAAVAAIVLATLCGATVSVAWEARIATQERDRAQQRFNAVRGLARSVIFDLEKKIAAIPGTTQVRKDLLSVAVHYLDSVAKDGYDDPGLQGELAAGFIRVGNIQGNPQDQNLGDLTAALESYAKAERIARALIARHPTGKSQTLLGEVLTAQAYGAQFANQHEKGVAKAMEALQVARDRLHSDPTSTDARFQLGAALQCMAASGTGKDKLPYLEEEASVFDTMLDQDPSNPDRVRNAALAHKNIAGLLIGSKVLGDAPRHLKRAEELDAALVRAAPNNPEHKMDLAIDLGQWGEYYDEKGDTAKAIQYTKEGLAIRRELVSADPKDMRAQSRLAYSLSRLGDLLINTSVPQALVSYREAKSIAELLPTASVREERLADAMSGIGEAYEKLGDARRSCSAYGEAAKLYRVLKNLPDHAIQAAAAEKAFARCSDGNR